MIKFKNRKLTLLILLLTLSLVVVACSPSEDSDQLDPVEENDTSEEAEDDDNSSEENMEDSTETMEVNIEGEFTMMQAVDAFIEKFPTGQIEQIDYEHRGQNNYEYELQGYADGQEIEIVYDANTGDQLSEEVDEDDEDGPYLNFDNIVSVQEAYDVALDALTSNDAKLESWSLDVDDGVAAYTFDFDNSQGDDLDIKVNAETLDIIEIDD